MQNLHGSYEKLALQKSFRVTIFRVTAIKNCRYGQFAMYSLPHSNWLTGTFAPRNPVKVDDARQILLPWRALFFCRLL